MSLHRNSYRDFTRFATPINLFLFEPGITVTIRMYHFWYNLLMY